MKKNDFAYRNNWKEHEGGLIPPCINCPIDDCPHMKEEYMTVPKELANKCYKYAVPAMVKFGFGSVPIGYMCLRANLWLFGLPYKGVRK